MTTIIKKKAVGESEKGMEECGIRDEKVLYNGAQIAAQEKTRAVVNYLDLPVVNTRRDKERFDKMKEALSEDLFRVFDQQEQTQASLWALTWTFFIGFFLFAVVYFNLPCTPSSTIGDCVCPYLFNDTAKNLFNGEEKNRTENISMNVSFSSSDEIQPVNNDTPLITNQ